VLAEEDVITVSNKEKAGRAFGRVMNVKDIRKKS
jgi:hypothetical protein